MNLQRHAITPFAGCHLGTHNWHQPGQNITHIGDSFAVAKPQQFKRRGSGAVAS